MGGGWGRGGGVEVGGGEGDPVVVKQCLLLPTYSDILHYTKPE